MIQHIDNKKLSILTFKIRLKRNFVRRNKKSEKKRWYKFRRQINKYIKVARRIANYCIKPNVKFTKLTSADVKRFGKLNSGIANQIIRKYKGNIKCKKISNVNLTIPACSTSSSPSIVYDKVKTKLTIKPLKLNLRWKCPIDFEKINQVELNNKFAFICATVADEKKKKYKECIGVDLNIRHNLATVGYKKKNKCTFLGKGYIYGRVKFKEIRRRYQKQGRLNRIKQMGSKESRVMNDLNQKISKQIIDIAIKREANISFEQLSGVRNARSCKGFKYFLNSWQFFRLQKNVVYKSKLRGIKTVFIDPCYTSQDCSNCGTRNKTITKKYHCDWCELDIHRDKNASFNIEDRGRKELYQA